MRKSKLKLSSGAGAGCAPTHGMLRIAAVRLVAPITGYVPNAPTKVNAGNYFASKINSAEGSGSISATAGALIKKSPQFCPQRGSNFEMVESQVAPMALGSFDDASVTFKCVAPAGSAATSPEADVSAAQVLRAK